MGPEPGSPNEGEASPEDTTASAQFDLAAIAATFPDCAETMRMERYLVDRETSTVRVTRTYQPTPAHLHQRCDEHLLVLSGRGTFWTDDPAQVAEFGPGTFLFFRRGTVHALPELREVPVVFLAIDTPRREPEDVVFVNAEDGDPDRFVAPVVVSEEADALSGGRTR